MNSFLSVPTDHPANVVGMAHNSTSFTLSWDPPPPEHHNGIIREYRVSVTERLTGRILQFSTTNTDLVVTDLRPYYEYDCVVVAITVDEGPHSSAIVVRTREARKAVFKYNYSITLIRFFMYYSTIYFSIECHSKCRFYRDHSLLVSTQGPRQKWNYQEIHSLSYRESDRCNYSNLKYQ